MDIETFRSIMTQVAPLTEQVTLHLMGEPLLHPEFAKFIEICRFHGVPVFVVTNGLLLNDVKEEILLDPIVRQVNFSLHSFHDNFGPKDPSTYLKRIFKLVERAFVERPDLYLNFRLWNLDEEQKMGPENQMMLNRICQHFDFEFNTEVNVRQKKSVRIKNRLYLHFDTEFIWPSLDLPVLGQRGTCYGLKSHFGILADGTVVPCCLDKEGKIPLGNVHDRSIAEILASERAQSILEGFYKNKLVESLCQRCQYITRFQNKSGPAAIQERSPS